ncbi:MAG: heme exporter protein CcmB [Ignavibacteriales bacterium]|nr:heme exporter protein CcmB [Ignavibacteriales bacterium]
MNFITSTLTIVSKDVRSELRTRYAMNALLMFVVTSVATILFALRDDEVSTEVLSGMFWVVIFFTAMSGLSRIFVSEEERGTTLTLQLVASPSVVYFGKLIFNSGLTLALSLAVTVLYVAAFPTFIIKSMAIFTLTIFLGSLGFAAAATIIAAIIAKANSKGTLYPVLSFPILIPLLMTVMKSTARALDGELFIAALGEFQILVSYLMIMIAGSYLLFDYVWKE